MPADSRSVTHRLNSVVPPTDSPPTQDSLAVALPLLNKHTRTAETVTYTILQRAESDAVYEGEIRSSPAGIECISCGRADELMDGLLLDLAGVESMIMAFQRRAGALQDLPQERRMTISGADCGAAEIGRCLLVV